MLRLIATMFLRWHYLVDVLAGITLATGGFFLARMISRREAGYREQNGLQPVWPPISLRGFAVSDPDRPQD